MPYFYPKILWLSYVTFDITSLFSTYDKSFQLPIKSFTRFATLIFVNDCARHRGALRCGAWIRSVVVRCESFCVSFQWWERRECKVRNIIAPITITVRYYPKVSIDFLLWLFIWIFIQTEITNIKFHLVKI